MPDESGFMREVKRLLQLEEQVRKLHSEVDCRIEHGAFSDGHLEYVRTRLRLMLHMPVARRARTSRKGTDRCAKCQHQRKNHAIHGKEPGACFFLLRGYNHILCPCPKFNEK